jgi:hypothetical protein
MGYVIHLNMLAVAAALAAAIGLTIVLIRKAGRKKQ